MAGVRAQPVQLTGGEPARKRAPGAARADDSSVPAAPPAAGPPAEEQPAVGTAPFGPARLLGPAEVRALAARLGVRPTKQLGQNFVIDPNTIRRIVRAARLRPDDTVVEVGPGLGSLTLGLLEAAERVIAVEIDPVLAQALPETVAERFPDAGGRFELVLGDALRLRELPGPAPTAMVANLPYNVAVPVLLHMLEGFPSLERILVMVQAEVADRLAAGPGGRVYGVPSVKARWYADVQRAGSVGRSVFWPAPHVDSGLVALERQAPRDAGAGTGIGRREVFAVVDAAFAQRRKTLRAALAGWAGSAAAAEEILRAAGVDPAARGEQLSVDRFAAIASAAARRSATPKDSAAPNDSATSNDSATLNSREPAP
jgi:16S rRNA (adenine1518-N6/adenine1519-N6)-dimethyltransferase